MASNETGKVRPHLRELPADDPIDTRGFLIGTIRSAKPLPPPPAPKQSAPQKKPVSR